MADESQNSTPFVVKVVGAAILLTVILAVVYFFVGYWSNEVKAPAHSEQSNPGP